MIKIHGLKYNLLSKLQLNLRRQPINLNLNFHTLKDEHLMLKNVCRKFSDKELRPFAQQFDKNSEFPKEQIKKLSLLGLMGIQVKSEYGGSNLDMLSTCIAVEELAKGCASTGIIVSIHNCLYAELLQTFGTAEQCERYLKPILNEPGGIGAFALSEHEAGSDVANISTIATACDDHFLLNGTKAWVTSAYEAKIGIVFATVDKSMGHRGITTFIVPFNMAGVELGRKELKMGIKGTSTCDLNLRDVKIPRQNIIGNIGDGFKIAMKQLQVARIGVAAQALGIGQATLDLSLEYANNRMLFGRKLMDMQLIKGKIAKMAVDLESARLLTWKAAILKDNAMDYRKLSSMAKLAASKCATSNAHQCVQILGGVGYTEAMAAERHYRDARITQIYGGVTDVQKLLIAERCFGEYIDEHRDE